MMMIEMIRTVLLEPVVFAVVGLDAVCCWLFALFYFLFRYD